MINSSYFARRTQLDKHLGVAFRFESVEIGANAETFEEAKEEVQNRLTDYIAELKSKVEAEKTPEQRFKDDLDKSPDFKMAGGEMKVPNNK